MIFGLRQLKMFYKNKVIIDNRSKSTYNVIKELKYKLRQLFFAGFRAGKKTVIAEQSQRQIKSSQTLR